MLRREGQREVRPTRLEKIGPRSALGKEVEEWPWCGDGCGAVGTGGFADGFWPVLPLTGPGCEASGSQGWCRIDHVHVYPTADERTPNPLGNLAALKRMGATRPVVEEG